jgi:hypothetical protein
METQPPEGVRPAQLAFLLDRSIHDKAWTATICDLAARGYLTISEGRLSSDGMWWWDGERWVVAAGIVSRDGSWWWDPAIFAL